MSDRALDYYYDRAVNRATWTALGVFRRKTRQQYIDALETVSEDECRAAIREACAP